MNLTLLRPAREAQLDWDAASKSFFHHPTFKTLARMEAAKRECDRLQALLLNSEGE